MQGDLGVAFENRVNNHRLWESGFIVLRGCGAPLVPTGECVCLVCIIL